MDFIADEIKCLAVNYIVLLLLIVWISAIASAFIDNIPFVMSMVPIIATLSRTLHVDPVPLYWALSLGGCLGGNGTLVGASANVVAVGMAERHGYHISFIAFLKQGMLIMLLTVALSSVYLVLRYGLAYI